ncbi:MAG: SurA N-terminal domain-containing protein [Gammaproteobacteria bacterium]|nr:SurA N-terminal domain-containing protein [Gammaproteobacteria bacterium]
MFLQRMREKTQSWVAYVIVSLLVLSFAFWGISSYFGQNQSGGPVASVNGEDISFADFSSAYRTFLQSSYAQSQYFGQQETLAKQVVLKNLIERLAINQYLAGVGFAVSQDQIDAALMSVPLFSDNGVFSPALFKRFLMANNTTAQAFISDFSARMVMAQWSQGLQMSSFSTELELLDTISLLRQKRNILYAIIPASSHDIPSISSEDIQTYYMQHKENYISPEQVKISYVILRFSDLLSRVKPTEKELLSYYAQHSARYDKPERWQVNIFSMNSPLSESEIIKQIDRHSENNHPVDNVSTVKLVQEKVWLTADRLTRDVGQTLAVTPVGHATKLFKTGKDSYIVYFLLAHETAVNKQYSDVKKEIKEAYVHEVATQQWTTTLEEMSQLAYEHPDTLNPLAKHVGLQVHASDFFTENYDKKIWNSRKPRGHCGSF